MGNLINESNLINATMDMNESILQTQYTRFLQESPTFVTYYRVNNIESTTDQGFMNVERTIGPDSPIRYNKVNDLPLYGLEQIVLSLDEDQEGIDMNYTGSGIIIPGTIVPLPSDNFYINYLKSTYVFQVTNISLDTIRSNPYYKIDFKLRSIDDGETVHNLDRQTTDEFNCVHTNVGTEDKILIKSADLELLDRLTSTVKSIEEYYQMAFYDQRYNSFLFNHDNGQRYYDRALTMFMMKVNMFNKKGTYKTLKLTNEAKSTLSQLEYHNSVYRALEKRDASLLKNTRYHLVFVGDFESVFTKWQDSSIRVVEQGIKAGNSYYIRTDLIEMFKEAEDLFKVNQADDEHTIKQKSIIVPDENMRPVYVPEANITNYFTPETTIEEAAVIPRGDIKVDMRETLVAEDGTLDLDSLFSGTPINAGDSVVLIEAEELDADVVEQPIIHVMERESTEESELVERPIVVINRQDFSIPESKFVLEMTVPEYLTDTSVNQHNTMEVTIAKYFGGHIDSVRDLDLDGLEEYLDYIDINSFESFILTPMLLFVLSKYTKQS